jgi:DNA-binding transcriptional LysR family regulator
MDHLDAMRIFVAVAKHESFAAAARDLRLSPSVVTRSIAQLEDRLGSTLFHRTTRSVRLTERGGLYLESCRQILQEIDSAERRIRGENAEPRGELNVAAPIVFGRLHVMPAINRVLAEHSALSVRLTLADRNVFLVDEGADVAIRIGEPADSSMIMIKLGAVSHVLVASPAYLRKRGVPNTPSELAGHDIIAYEGPSPATEWRFENPEKAIRVDSRFSVNTIDAAIAAAEEGGGIARLLSYQVKAAVLAGRLSLVLHKFAPPPLPVNVIYPARRIASVNVIAFVKATRDHFKADPIVPVEEWGV